MQALRIYFQLSALIAAQSGDWGFQTEHIRVVELAPNTFQLFAKFDEQEIMGPDVFYGDVWHDKDADDDVDLYDLALYMNHQVVEVAQ